MTVEQQKQIEDSLWVVDAVLKRLKRQGDEDLRQDLFLYMCKCIQRFDVSRGTKWTSYAYESLYLYALRTLAKEKKLTEPLVSEEKFFYLSDNGAGENELIETCQAYCITITLTPDERAVAEYIMQGYCLSDISRILRRPPKRIRELKAEIKRKYLALEKMTPP